MFVAKPGVGLLGSKKPTSARFLRSRFVGDLKTERVWSKAQDQAIMAKDKPTDKVLAEKWGCCVESVRTRREELVKQERETQRHRSKFKIKKKAHDFLKWREAHA